MLCTCQGDGIDIKVLEKLLNAVLDKGYSPQSVAFGMGGGLLQKVPALFALTLLLHMAYLTWLYCLQVNRDTMSFATKLGFIEYADGTTRDIMKVPFVLCCAVLCLYLSDLTPPLSSTDAQDRRR